MGTQCSDEVSCISCLIRKTVKISSENPIIYIGGCAWFKGRNIMAMIINNNSVAMMTLGELNKNISRAGKDLKKLASGERITSAGDDASGYSISERMRVRVRALEQDEQNVQNGQALLNVAEGAIQSQIELMKTIKQKVIDADNDTNTDIDRYTIQKEINHAYQEIEDIAQETNYNGVRLLAGGNYVEEKVLSWVVKSASSLLEGSDAMNMINVIPNVYPTLNGITGPFDLFQPATLEQTSLSSIGFSPDIQFSGGIDNVYTIDSSFNTVDSFDGVAFKTANYSYVLTKTPSNTHKYRGYIGDYTIEDSATNVIEIDIGSCNSVQDVLTTIQGKVPSVTGSGVNSNGENYLVSSMQISGETYTGYKANVSAVSATGLFSSPQNFSGGKDASGIWSADPDISTYKPATKATFSLTGLTADTGITIHLNTNAPIIQMMQFVQGNSPPAPAVPSNGVLTVGVNYSGTFKYGKLTAEMSNGNLTLTANQEGSRGNSYYVEDGISANTYEFLAASPLVGKNAINYAYATIDVSSYSNVETLIDDLKGKAIAFTGGGTDARNANFGTHWAADARYSYFEFVDSNSANQTDKMWRINRSKVLDLDALRGYVASGMTIGDGFAKLFTDNIDPSDYREGRIEEAKDSNGQTIGIKIKASDAGNRGNEEKLFLAQGQLRSYTLDYGQWFADNQSVSIPDFLNNKGFRAYCASCDNQVFNFHFITESLPNTPRPESDPNGEDIKHIYIDVSNVTDATSLVQAIYEQGMADLTSSDPDLNHFMRLATDGDKLIIYDERRLTDDYLQHAVDANGDLLYPEYQWDTTYDVGGAKIADGVWDNVEIGERKIYAQDLIIHHTDKASMNIHLKIPQTTMDHLFGYDPGSQDWSEFNVMTSKSRENLLGNWAGKTRSGKTITKDEEGLLDHALNYLIGANCLVGAQNMRLKMTEANIVTQREGTIASESTIRDADMAKEMTSYTKNNVLAQAAQSMLAQANQNGAGVLKLLQ